MRLEGRGCRDMIPSGAVLFFFFFWFIHPGAVLFYLATCVRAFLGCKVGSHFYASIS